MAATWVKFLPHSICHVGPTYKKTIPSGGGAVVVLGGERVRLFGSYEERGEGLNFYYMWAPHDISYVEKI